MEIREGDCVRVNLAPFIGSAGRSRQAIPCEVRHVKGDLVEVVAQPPYRGVSLWVQANWIEGKLDHDHLAA